MYSSRSNYFAVRDAAAFRRFCRRHSLEPIVNTDDPALHGFLLRDAAMPEDYETLFTEENEETLLEDEEEDEDLEEVLTSDEVSEDTLAPGLAPLLADGHVAVILQVGSDKMRFLFGEAWAVNSRGETRRVYLDDIYSAAQALGGSITRAEY